MKLAPTARFILLALCLLASIAYPETRVRVVNANITSGDRQSYDDGAGIRILQGLQGDIVLLQEFNYKGNTDRDLRELVEQIGGKEFHFYRTPQGDENGIPNGVISRFPILESGSVDDRMGDRDTAYAKIQLPGGKILWALSAHLSHGDDGKRADGARRMVDFVKRKVGKEDLLVIGGDLNTSNREETTLRVLSEVVSDKVVPTDTEGKPGTSRNRNKPYDFVLPNSLLEKFHVCLDLFARTGGGDPVKFPNGAVIDTRNFRDISKLAPAKRSDSDARNMQHMAVAKDFLIP